MQKEIIDKYCDIFKVKKVKVMNKIEFINNPMIICLPEGAGYMTDELEIEIKNDDKIKINELCIWKLRSVKYE